MCRTRDQCTNHKSLQKHTNPRTTKYNKLDASCGSRRLAFPNCRHAAHKGNLVLSLPPAASLSSMPNTSIHCPKAIFPLRVYRGSISGFSGGYALFPNISANNTSRWLEMDPELLLSFGACFHIVRAARCSSVHVTTTMVGLLLFRGTCLPVFTARETSHEPKPCAVDVESFYQFRHVPPIPTLKDKKCEEEANFWVRSCQSVSHCLFV